MPGDCRLTTNIFWVMLACFAAGIGGPSIMAVWSELLLSRACARHDIPFPSQACDQHPDAQTEATLRQTYMQLAQSIPNALTVGMVSSIADSRGRRLAMITSFISTLMFCVGVLVVPDTVGSLDGYWVILGIALAFSFTGGNTATFSSAMSVIADVSHGWTAVQRTNLFMMLEAALWGGGIVGPILGSSVAKVVGLRQTFLFAVIMIGVGIVLLLCFYTETLRDSEREAFTWSRANPLSAMSPLFSHPVMRRFFFLFFVAGIGQNGFFFVTNLYLIRVADFSLLELSVFASIGTGTTVAGLILALPLLQRCLSTKGVICFSVFDSAVQMFLLAMMGLPFWWKISGQEADDTGSFGSGSLAEETAMGNWMRTWGPYAANAVGFGTVAVLCATGEVKHSVALSLGAIGAEQAIVGIISPLLFPPLYAATEKDMPEFLPLLGSGLTIVGLVACMTLPNIEQYENKQLGNGHADGSQHGQAYTKAAAGEVQNSAYVPDEVEEALVAAPFGAYAADYRRRQRRLHNPNSLSGLLADPQASADLRQSLLAVESTNHRDGDSTETKAKKDFTAQVLALRGRRGSATIQHLGL